MEILEPLSLICTLVDTNDKMQNFTEKEPLGMPNMQLLALTTH